MAGRWFDRFYITEPKYGFAHYRKPIVWFDKLLVVCGILAGIAGRVMAGMWVLQFVLRPDGLQPGPGLFVLAVLLWLPGEYFCRTGHRGLIYYHVDLLADYLDRRLQEQRP